MVGACRGEKSSAIPILAAGRRDSTASPPIRGSIINTWCLQNTETAELFTFVTASATGRRAVGNLLHHYNRMLRTNANELPVVKLKVGGFNHKDERIGWVPTPVFAVVGRAPRDSAAKPDTSSGGDMSDAIPF